MSTTFGNQNPIIKRNAIAFAGLATMTHVLACFIYGFLFRVPSQDTSSQYYPVFASFAHGMLVVVGFGLLLSYLKKLVWTGMGFTLLITVMTIELYFMINAFWIKADVLNQSKTYFSSEDKSYNLYLTNNSQAHSPYWATITGGFRCALAMIVAFSSILGRAGPLEAWFVVTVGTIGYQLNRQIIQNWSQDAGGTSAIFVFGGFMSLVIGFMRKFREKGDSQTGKHAFYTGNNFSATIALLGTLFCWIFFPILVFDYPSAIAAHPIYTGPITVWYSIAAATLMSYTTSVMINKGLLIRDIVYGPIAGGVIASSASFYVTNPVYGILIGAIAGLIQVIVMNVVQKKVARDKNIFHTVSFTLFGIQGLLGAVFSAAWQAISRGQFTDGFTFNFDNEFGSVYGWLISLISAAMGIGFGLIAGLLVMLVSGHTREDHFHDFTYWLRDDGIRYDIGDPALPGVEMNFKQGSAIKGKYDYL